ncbi:kinase-like domain-containing protein [Coniochaeta sp. 2T2.1]|nr:kinase-like domain-containing protein [Coniochaeta sp. 2T2.1]
MFSSAFKSISSNINSNYTVSQNQTSTAGPWKIYDAKKKSTGKSYSVFTFDKKSLDAHSSGLSRSSASAFKKVTEEVVERLKKEASSLAKLRHPSVLELVEPVEETRGGGLQFVTEAVTTSLASLLQEKDDQERSGGVGGRSSRYVTEEPDGTRRRRELEIDELEIQKGLLQVSKALEFLHENAGLVHGNLTPDAILINAKGDWKISGLSFCSPPENSSKPTSFQPIALSEVLHLDTRLPRVVQINLDYTSPDFVLDNNLTSAADMFSLGLLCIALYNSPHRSPLECNSSITAYKRQFQSSSSVPNQSNNYLSSRPIPKDLANGVLPRLITRRPAQRMNAKEFQESEYFDNILVSTIRFLDAFPAKTANEKTAFLKGLIKVLPSFPKSVMEKKVLPALLDELKDRDLISLILHNVFKIIELLPSGKRAFGDRIRPSLKEIFVTNAKPTEEKDPSRDAGLMIILEQLAVIADNCSGKEFKDDILPIIFVALQSSTPSIVDAALRGLPTILPVLDFSTIKNELFPVVASIFSKTNSLAIKVRGLQAFVILCGGSSDLSDDGLNGLSTNKKTSSSTALDKYTMQEKIMPLIKAIKTKEPAVMIAALNVCRVVGQAADAEFVAMDILPALWNMSLGPLLNLEQFKQFMDLIKSLSARVEDEQTRKLQELGQSNGTSMPNEDFMSFGTLAGSTLDTNGATEHDFERLVKGKTTTSASPSNPMDSWDSMGSTQTVTSPAMRSNIASPSAPAFSWSSPPPTSTTTAPPVNNQFGAVKAQQPAFRTVTPDLGQFAALKPSATQFSQPLQPSTPSYQTTSTPSFTQPSSTATSVNWGPPATSNPWASPPATSSLASPMSSSMSLDQRPNLPHNRTSSSSFSLPPPPNTSTTSGLGSSGFSLKPPPGTGGSSFSQQPIMPTTTTTPSWSTNTSAPMGSMGSMINGLNSGNSMSSMMGGSMNGNAGSLNSMMSMAQRQQQQQQPTPQPPQPQKSGLDKYASLL